MKKQLVFIICFCIGIGLQAQVSKTVNVVKAGTLSTLLTANEDSTVTYLTITGTIDSLDFITMSSMT